MRHEESFDSSADDIDFLPPDDMQQILNFRNLDFNNLNIPKELDVTLRNM